MENTLEKTEEQDTSQEVFVPKTVSALQKTGEMVAKYSKRLVGDARAQQFVATLALLANQDPKIASCTPSSLGAAMMACVHLDLMPNTPSQHAWIIPYLNRSSGKYEAQFQIGYKGLAELAYRTGQVRSISAEIVFPEDKFKVELGTKRKLTHIPSFDIDRTNAKRVTHAYATVVLQNGDTVFDVIGKEQIQKVRNTAKAKSTDAPWNAWAESMIQKTVVKRLAKLLPSSATDQRIAMASSIDSWAQTGRLALVDGELTEKQEVPEEEKTISIEKSTVTHESLTEKMGDSDEQE